LTEAPDLVAGLWRPLYVEWRNYAINYVKRPIAQVAKRAKSARAQEPKSPKTTSGPMGSAEASGAEGGLSLVGVWEKSRSKIRTFAGL
jgi:hypothetical protein